MPRIAASLRSRASERSSPAKRPAYDGRLQGIADGRAVGWAWDSSDPERRVEVAIEVDGEIVADGVADIARAELVAERIGDGAHGFELQLPESLLGTNLVKVAALAGPEHVALPRSPSFWQSARPGSSWSEVTFRYGREGDPEVEADIPVKVPPAPEPPPPRALVGRAGWLFDAAELDPGPEPSDADLDRLARRLGGIAAACADVGIAYVVACVPDKLDAVAEGSPLGTERRRAWVGGLRRHMRDLERVDLLDLLPVLQDARRHGPCYQRTDPDWNDRGAFFVARALLKEAAKHVPALCPLALQRLRLIERSGCRGPLADAPKVRFDAERLLPIDLDCAEEEGLEVDLAHLHARRMPVERHLVDSGEHHVRLLVRPDGGPAGLSVVGDAACLPLLPWLAESAGRTTFFWAPTPPLEPVELELPAAVLHLVRQRELARLALL